MSEQRLRPEGTKQVRHSQAFFAWAGSRKPKNLGQGWWVSLWWLTTCCLPPTGVWCVNRLFFRTKGKETAALDSKSDWLKVAISKISWGSSYRCMFDLTTSQRPSVACVTSVGYTVVYTVCQLCICLCLTNSAVMSRANYSLWLTNHCWSNASLTVHRLRFLFFFLRFFHRQ